MGPHIRWLVSLVLASVLAGSFGVLAACLSLCEPAHAQVATNCHEAADKESTGNTARVTGTGHGCCVEATVAPATTVAGRPDAPLGIPVIHGSWNETTAASHVSAPRRLTPPPPSPPSARTVLRN